METVDDEMVLKDRTMTVNLYHIIGSAHADTLLMAYFPRERLLVEADVFSPGGAVAPYAANLMENIRKRNLRIDRIVPIHGTIAPYGELVKAVPGRRGSSRARTSARPRRGSPGEAGSRLTGRARRRSR
jgi:hypothetical protein